MTEHLQRSVLAISILTVPAGKLSAITGVWQSNVYIRKSVSSCVLCVQASHSQIFCVHQPQSSQSTSFRHRKVFTGFPTKAYFYAKTDSSDTFVLPVSGFCGWLGSKHQPTNQPTNQLTTPVPAYSLYHASVSLQQQRVSIAQCIARWWAHMLQVVVLKLAYPAPPPPLARLYIYI